MAPNWSSTVPWIVPCDWAAAPYAQHKTIPAILTCRRAELAKKSASLELATDSPRGCDQPQWASSVNCEDELHSFRSPQKVSRLISGRSPGLEGGWKLPDRFAFPDSKTEWHYEAANPRLQWRDRAGLSPDFPFTP